MAFTTPNSTNTENPSSLDGKSLHRHRLIATLGLLLAFLSDKSKTLNFRRHHSHVEAAAHLSTKD